MKVNKIAALLALAAAVACSKGENETVDTMTVPGVDTTAGMAVPVTDTVLTTTTTDTIQGEARRDSVSDTTARRP